MNESGNPKESDTSVDYLAGLQLLPLTREHDRAGFDCGYERLNEFLKTTAREHAKKGISATYVATYDGKAIVGYYTIVPNKQWIVQGISGEGSDTSVNVVLFGRLAVSLEYRGRGIGEWLLYNGMYDSQIIADQNGAQALVVDALKETGAQHFYAKYGFRRLNLPEDDRTI